MHLYQHYADFLDTIPDGAIVVTELGTMELVNCAAALMFGYMPTELNGQPLELLIPQTMRAAHKSHTQTFFGKPKPRPMGEGLPLLFLGLRQDGSHFPVEITISPLTINGKKYAVAIIRDSSERQRTEQRIRRELEMERNRALTDDLTGLANRRLFLDILNRCVTQHAIDNTPFALAYIDLDNFKSVNDLRGHQVGDTLLQRIAATLHQASRDGDTLARLGGDEFALIICNISKQAAEKMLHRLHQVTTDSLNTENIHITLSIGWAHSEQQKIGNFRDLIHAADEAMYSAKREGKNRVANVDNLAVPLSTKTISKPVTQES